MCRSHNRMLANHGDNLAGVEAAIARKRAEWKDNPAKLGRWLAKIEPIHAYAERAEAAEAAAEAEKLAA